MTQSKDLLFHLRARILFTRMKIPQTLRPIGLVIIFVILTAQFSFGWGKDGHKIINRVAIEMLPADLPAFLHTPQAIDEIEYLGREPDRWRSSENRELSVAQAPEHFIDLDLADLVAPDGLPTQRFAFIRDVYRAQRKYLGLAAKLTPQKIGLLPWQANEEFERLRDDMREYRFRIATRLPVDGAELAILYDTGVLGHYVADGSQPLHTTVDYDGWVEKENPNGFTRSRGIHSKFETQFVHDNLRAAQIRALVPEKPRILDSPFQNFVEYLRTSHSQVSELYKLEKHDGFEGTGTAQSRSFTAERLAAGATMLRDMIVTAWVRSAPATNESASHER
jgi:hypothetical protein